jgi:hypothetical protein
MPDCAVNGAGSYTRRYTTLSPIMTPTPAKRALPSKESSLFRELLNLYETRQLKKGQKTADQILKKFPEHGGPYNLTMDKPV